MLLCPCRCYGAWFHSNSSWSECTMLLRKRFHSNSSLSEWEILLRKWFHSSNSWSEWEILLRKRFHSNSSWNEWEILLRKRFHSNSSWSEWETLLRGSGFIQTVFEASGRYYWRSLSRWRCVCDALGSDVLEVFAVLRVGYLRIDCTLS
jgi:hypothetical protein